MLVNNLCFLLDGWTASDVNYTWKIPDPVQFVKNLNMPGGFVLYNYTNKRCDVRTTTGNYLISFENLFKKTKLF